MYISIADFSSEAVVYPTLLEARDDRRQYTISLDDGNSVKLSSSSAIDDVLTLHTYEEEKLVVQTVRKKSMAFMKK